MRAVSFFSILALTGAIAFTSPALAQGDAANGERVFNKCKACHTVEEGKNKVGPTLYNVIGRRAGSLEDFRYSSAMKEYGAAGKVWDEETMNGYLERTEAHTSERQQITRDSYDVICLKKKNKK